MESPKKIASRAFGFVTVRHHPSLGFFGGYLVLNGLARPLEFHCTLPLQPTKAQQILFGSSLHEFICGEQIARALLMKAKSTPDAILTDTQAVLSVRHTHRLPVAHLVTQDDSSDNASALVRPAVTREADQYLRFKKFGCSFHVLRDYGDDASVIQNLFEEDKPPLDLFEPFGRIEEALMEAHPAAKAA